VADGGNELLRAMTPLAGATVALELGDDVTARRRLVVARRSAEELRQPVIDFELWGSEATVDLLHGELDVARPKVREYLQLGRRTDQPEALMLWAAFDLELRRITGRLNDDALRPLRDSPPGTDRLGAYSLTRFLYEGGAHDLAREQYDAAMRELPNALPNRIDAGPVATNLALLCARFEDRAGAERLAPLLRPHGDQFFQAVTSQFVTWHYLAMLAAAAGDHAGADDAFERAIDAHRRVSAPLFVAETQLEWAAARQRAGRGPDDTVDELLTAARRAALERGAAGLLERIDAVREAG
jgi:tetratricopeptide (TPR) repeat protein